MSNLADFAYTYGDQIYRVGLARLPTIGRQWLNLALLAAAAQFFFLRTINLTTHIPCTRIVRLLQKKTSFNDEVSNIEDTLKS